MQQTEAQVRAELSIPLEARFVLILDSSAHLDWDWQQTFDDYYTTNGTWGQPAVRQIFASAIDCLDSNPVPGPGPYYYSICEAGYVQLFAEREAGMLQKLQQYTTPGAQSLYIIGGGITSPDNLLSSGEAFIRNYLVGKLWLAQNVPGALPLLHCWIPDDFGNDPELPVAVVALGMRNTAFWRLPGFAAEDDQSGTPGSLPYEMAHSTGVDFMWQASDGSNIFAHWLFAGGYGWGSGIDGGSGANYNIGLYLDGYLPSGDGYLAAKTPYLYVPMDDDFTWPVTDLVTDAANWNETQYPSTGVYVVSASFAHFCALAAFHRSNLATLQLPSTPYWTGHYATRPALKILHYDTSRTLLAAEAIGVVAGLTSNDTFRKNLADAWALFVPSTHHDYITGTAVEDVYNNEQLPRLQQAQSAAQSLCTTATTTLANLVSVYPQPGETPALVINPIGDPFAGILEYTGTIPVGTQGVRIGDSVSSVQSTYEGGLLFSGTAPSLGYTAAYFTPQSGTTQQSVTITSEDGGSTYVLQNSQLQATITLASNWSIASLIDLATGRELLLDPGNDLVYYEDSGDLYEFGNEFVTKNAPQIFERVATTVTAVSATILEYGPLRVRLQTVVNITGSSDGKTYAFTREYALVAGEPFLRMTTTGSAPSAQNTNSGYSVMCAFPLSTSIDGIVHGTACHWTYMQPLQTYQGSIFRATHNWLVPQSSNPVPTFYHPEVPAWTIEGANTLLGCVLRNTPHGLHGASGSDTATHIVHYAIRVPSSLGSPETGQPLAEALHYQRPPMVVEVTTSQMTLPETYSLAQVTSGFGIILAAKPGDVVPNSIVLRLYQPTNAPQNLEITMGSPPQSALAITALEDVAEGPFAPTYSVTNTGFTAAVTTALTSVALTW